MVREMPFLSKRLWHKYIIYRNTKKKKKRGACRANFGLQVQTFKRRARPNTRHRRAAARRSAGFPCRLAPGVGCVVSDMSQSIQGVLKKRNRTNDVHRRAPCSRTCEGLWLKLRTVPVEIKTRFSFPR